MPRLLPTTLAGLGLVPIAALGATLLASHYNGHIYTLDLTIGGGGNGTLSITADATGCGTTPGWLELYSDTKTLYCFDESWSGSGFITQYSVAADGKLAITARMSTTGNDVHGLLYGGLDGRSFMASAQYSRATITTYKLPLSNNTKILQREKFILAAHGPNVRQDAPHPHETLLDPTGKFILVPDLGADLIRVFSINTISGKLTLCGNGQASPGDGPRHGKFWAPKASSTDGLRLYTVNELSNSVSAWTVTYTGGCMTLNRMQTLSTYPPGKKGGPMTKAAELRVVYPYLYVSNRADETFGTQKDSIALYKIDATGAINWVEAENAHSYYPRTFQFNKAGTLVAVGGQTSSNVAILARDPTTGKLGKLVANLQIAQVGRPGQEDGLSAVVWVE